jgi:hypothetical protein
MDKDFNGMPAYIAGMLHAAMLAAGRTVCIREIRNVDVRTFDIELSNGGVLRVGVTVHTYAKKPE